VPSEPARRRRPNPHHQPPQAADATPPETRRTRRGRPEGGRRSARQSRAGPYEDPTRSAAQCRETQEGLPRAPKAQLILAINHRREPTARQIQHDARVEDDRREDDEAPEERGPPATRTRCEAERSIGRPRRASREAHALPLHTIPTPGADATEGTARRRTRRGRPEGTSFTVREPEGRRASHSVKATTSVSAGSYEARVHSGAKEANGECRQAVGRNRATYGLHCRHSPTHCSLKSLGAARVCGTGKARGRAQSSIAVV
jgi:hypothetical protein